MLALFASRLLPRYDWQQPPEVAVRGMYRDYRGSVIMVRYDRWTGRGELRIVQ